MEKLKLILLILIYIFFSEMSFGFLSSETKVRLHSSDNATLIDLANQTKQEISGNNNTDIILSTPMQVDIKGHLPILLIPIKDGVTEVKLNPPSYKEAINTYGQKEMSNIVSEIFIDIQLIQKKIQTRDAAGAMSLITSLQNKYPNVAFLDFIRGSILFLQGQKSEARTAVKKALESHPDYEEGQKFLKSLGEKDE